LTHRELRVLEAFLETGNQSSVAVAFGVSRETIRRILNRAKVKLILDDRQKDEATINTVGPSAIRARMRRAAMGWEKLRREDMEAAKWLAKWDKAVREDLDKDVGVPALPPGMDIAVVLRNKGGQETKTPDA